jgi:hypothetical protein
MKNLFLGLITMTLFFTACKKTECPTPVTPTPPLNLSGSTWNGFANIPAIPLSNRPFVLTFNADGTLTGSLTNGNTFALSGSWNLTPYSTSVKLFFTIVSANGNYVGQGTLTTDNTKIESGTATNATTPAANLTFALTKS